MFQLIVAALSSTDTSGGGGSITANWDNVSFSDDWGGSRTVSSTVVFTGGGNRQLLFEHDILFGELEVSVDAGAYVAAPTGYTVNVTTGQTVNIKYTCYYQDETATLTVTDNTLVALIDTITLAFNFTGILP